jgi:glycosyltransferase involved in cell wall biosynthesis
MRPLISIITTVYNAEKFLRECLESLCAQTYPNLEFIVVNDGSADGSLGIIREFEARDERFRVISRPNGGYGKACNTGMDAARGEFLAWLDGDDFAEADWISGIWEALKDADFDVALSDHFKFLHDGEEVFTPNPAPPQVTLGLSARTSPALVTHVIVWSWFYRTAFLRKSGVRFLETPGMGYQDASFSYKFISLAEKIAHVAKVGIHYRIHESNTSIYTANPFPFFLELEEIDKFNAAQGFNGSKWAQFNFTRIYRTFEIFWEKCGEATRRVLAEGAAAYCKEQNALGNYDPETARICTALYCPCSPETAERLERTVKSGKFNF